MDMDFTVRCPLVRRLRLVFGFCPSTHAFARCFLQTPPRGGSPCTLLALHLHQVGQKTFTSKLLSMPSTQRNRSRGKALRREAWSCLTTDGAIERLMLLGGDGPRCIRKPDERWAGLSCDLPSKTQRTPRALRADMHQEPNRCDRRC